MGIQEWARQEREAPVTGTTAGLTNLLEANNFRPNNCHKNCCGSGFLLDTCRKSARMFGSRTCKPKDRSHLQNWHTPCYVCNPDGSTRRRLAGKHDYLNPIIGNVGNNVRSDMRSDAIQQVMQDFCSKKNRKPRPYELVKIVKHEFDRIQRRWGLHVDGDFTTGEAF